MMAWIDCRPRLAIVSGEIKRRNIIIGEHPNIVEQYNAGVSIIRRAVDQLTGYQMIHSTEFGFLSTYIYTWATRLNADGTLLISPSFLSSTGGELSTISMLYFLISLANERAEDVHSGWTPPKGLLRPSTESYSTGTTTSNEPSSSNVRDISGGAGAAGAAVEGGQTSSSSSISLTFF